MATAKAISQVRILIAVWMLSIAGFIPTIVASMLSAVFTVLGVLIGIFPFLSVANKSEAATAPSRLSDKIVSRSIVGLPPPTDPRTIQQRQKTVKEIYAHLIQPDVTAIVLTGIGGVGKSTLAALVHRYVEEQRPFSSRLFHEKSIWLTINESATMADLAGTIFKSLGKSIPNLTSMTPQNQAVALFNALNTVEEVRLVVLDQFENLLDWQTGHALIERPGIAEWLDILNSQSCRCRILLTSRPLPQGTRNYPPTYMQEYEVSGLEIDEGIELLRKQGVEATEAELRTAVESCEGTSVEVFQSGLVHLEGGRRSRGRYSVTQYW